MKLGFDEKGIPSGFGNAELDGIPSGFGTLCWMAFPLVSECCSECHSLWFQNSVLDARTAGAALRDV